MSSSTLRRRTTADSGSTATAQEATTTTTTPETSGDRTPYSLSEDVFSGLSLIDLLVVVDAHLDLWTRGIRKQTHSWKEKADRLVEESKQRAQKIKLPRVNSDTFLPLSATQNRESSDHHPPSQSGVLSQKDRERLERRYRELRQKTTESFKRVAQKWEEEKTVRLRDKISFFCGVMNVLFSALLLGFAPTWIPSYYSAQIVAYLPFRVYDYKKKFYHYFLFDLCYFINLLCLVYLWILPGNPYLFEACYGLTLGSLGTAIATWRNSLVFHSLDKVISLAIHIFPPFVFTTIRHFYPNAEERYTALKHLPHLRPWRSIAISLTVYTFWQILYYQFVIVARKEKIKQGRATSFTFLINDKKRLIGKIAAKVPEAYREAAFMTGQAVYTFVTLLIPVFVLYDSKFWSSVYLMFLFAVSVWNGSSFYMDIFARKFEKELIALRKQMEEESSHRASPALEPTAVARSTPSESPILSPTPDNHLTMSRSTSLEGVAEEAIEFDGGAGSSNDGSLDGVIVEVDSEMERELAGEDDEESERDREGTSTPVKKAVGELFGKEGLGEVQNPNKL
ncbi:hypothetical protein T439DRAFT_321909 [Meredithblackwellia eburnea MCA 4105]